MSIISKQKWESSFTWVASVWACAICWMLAGCGLEGPWSYYPEDHDVYAGIYTYGYIVEDESPYVCFSKVYQLDETSAENFAFYDSAYVTVKGKFSVDGKSAEEELVLQPKHDKPQCFLDSTGKGVVGETYTLNAFFEWDSAGHKVKTKYSASATIPTGFGIKGVNAPQKGGKYAWHKVDDPLEVDFLEYPEDMNLYKFAMDYNDGIGGVLAYMDYDIKDGGENMNTTMNYMLSAFMEPDSAGYTGMSLHKPLESRTSMGYEENRVAAGLNMLDTIFIPNMNLPLGYSSLHFLATDDAYRRYHRYVLNSFEDPRVVPESNIENGMGVFSGMAHLVVSLHVKGEGVSYQYMALSDCVGGTGDGDSWNTKACRLYQDVYCSGAYKSYTGAEDELYKLNEEAPYYFADSSLEKPVDGFCFAPAIKAAMMLDSSSWSVFLLGLSEESLNNAYGDALKRYCVASNFKSVDVADCKDMESMCQESLEENYCKTYLWQWCADRNWDLEKYPQCASGLVSRYYLEDQKSSVLKREVDRICESSAGKNIKQCERE